LLADFIQPRDLQTNLRKILDTTIFDRLKTKYNILGGTRMKKFVSIFLTVCMLVSVGPQASAADSVSISKVNQYSAQFDDVSDSSWYAQYVKTAYEYGLMGGVSDTSFDPDGNLTVASAIVIACRLHSLYTGNNAVFPAGDPWYQPYLDYARRNDIIQAETEYSYHEPITRAGFATIISNGLPDTALPQINEIEEGDIPDVSTGSPYLDALDALMNAGVLSFDDAPQAYFMSAIMSGGYVRDDESSVAEAAQAIYRLYRAGVLVGSDEYGTFMPDAKITRSAASAILSCVVEPSLRRHVTLTTKPANLVPINQLNNLSSVQKKASTEELAQAYEAAKAIVEPLSNLNREAQLCGIAIALRVITENEIEYSTSYPHYNDPYGFFILHTASCAGCTRATGLCLNMLGIPYEHVNEDKYEHQWTRVNVNGTYWICDSYGLYCAPEESPYQHPNFS
jgi:hypothetical protein